MGEWQPIETAPKGRAIMVQGYGIYHGLPFPAIYDPSPYKPDEPWVNMLTKQRVPTHSLKLWCEMDLPEDEEATCRPRSPRCRHHPGGLLNDGDGSSRVCRVQRQHSEAVLLWVVRTTPSVRPDTRLRRHLREMRPESQAIFSLARCAEDS